MGQVGNRNGKDKATKTVDLSGLHRVGKNLQTEVVEPVAEIVVEVPEAPAESHGAPSERLAALGGKYHFKVEPKGTPDGEPSIEQKFRDADVYGETGGVVLTLPTAESRKENREREKP